MTPADENPEEHQHPEPVPPAEEQPRVVPPAQEYHQEPVPPAEEQNVEQVYDYTQGGEQPQIYEQPAIDPYADQEYQQPAPAPAPVPPPSQPAAPAPLSRPKGAPPRRRQAKVARAGGAPKRPGYAGGRPGSRTQLQPPTGSGFSIMTVLMMLVALVLLVLAIMVMAPTDLSHIKGYAGGKSSLEKKEPRNLLSEVQQVMLKDESITFTEEEVNQYLASRLKGSQSGAFGSLIKFKGVCVDFRPEIAEVFIERSFIGIPVTMSSRVKFNSFGNTTSWKSSGGKIGKLDMSGEKQFGPVLDTFLRLAETCNEEVTVIDSMTKVSFEDDKIVLDAR